MLRSSVGRAIVEIVGSTAAAPPGPPRGARGDLRRQRCVRVPLGIYRGPQAAGREALWICRDPPTADSGFADPKCFSASRFRQIPSASQVAWHASYCARGGKSFYLVQGASPSDLYLFGGDQGAELMDRGLVCGGSRFEDLGSLFQALRLALLPK